MERKKRSLTLRSKLMLSTIVPGVISFTLLTLVIFIALSGFANDMAHLSFMQKGEKYSHRFETRINEAMNYLTIMAHMLEMAAADNVDRGALRDMAFHVFEGYGILDGSSLYFEPNKFDGRDADYVVLTEEDVELAVERTDGTTASFLKELIRRSVLESLHDDRLSPRSPGHTWPARSTTCWTRLRR